MEESKVVIIIKVIPIFSLNRCAVFEIIEFGFSFGLQYWKVFKFENKKKFETKLSSLFFIFIFLVGMIMGERRRGLQLGTVQPR